ncbi:MAG: disulfide bond formation protein B [Halieaceae bacterium]
MTSSLLANLPAPRLTNWLLVAVCAFTMGVVYYLDGVLGLVPCPLCMTQRVFLLISGGFCLLAALHGPGILGRRIYAALAAVFALVGGGVAARHVWLQHLPEGQAPACGPGLEYMLENFPFTETLELILMGDGNCADVVWTFAGLSIPEQALLLFTGLVLVNIWQVMRTEGT